MTAQKPAHLWDVCLAMDRMPKTGREGETRDWRFPGNWIRRLSRTGRWQATQPRRASADQQSCVYLATLKVHIIFHLRRGFIAIVGAKGAH
jgi:hypothetical protein